MDFRKKSPWTANPGVPLTPMIDVVFLLLCFFVTSQIFAQWETEIDVALPTAATGGAPQRLPGEVIINVLADGAAVVNGQRLDDAQLRGLLDRLVELFPGVALFSPRSSGLRWRNCRITGYAAG